MTLCFDRITREAMIVALEEPQFARAARIVPVCTVEVVRATGRERRIARAMQKQQRTRRKVHDAVRSRRLRRDGGDADDTLWLARRYCEAVSPPERPSDEDEPGGPEVLCEVVERREHVGCAVSVARGLAVVQADAWDR